MEQFGAKQKVFKLPEMVETLVSLLDPLSALRLIRSRVVDIDTLKKSFSSEAWNKLIRRSLRDGSGQLLEVEVKNLRNILKLVKVDEPRTFLLPLLDLICQSGFVPESDQQDNEIHLICPSHPAAPHVVSHGDFMLLELVEAAFHPLTKWLFRRFRLPLFSGLSFQKTKSCSEFVMAMPFMEYAPIFVILFQFSDIWQNMPNIG